VSDDLGNPATPFNYHLELTQPQLKITNAALRSLLEEFDDEDSSVRTVLEEILRKLPDEKAMRAVRIDDELAEELSERESEDSDGDRGPPPAAA
jgi:hypothetical protein